MTALKNTRHEMFAAYIAKGMTAHAAYLAAGYEDNSGARANASRLNANENIQRRIEELKAAVIDKVIDSTAITKERIMLELAKIGFANVDDYIRRDESGAVYVDMSTATREQMAAVQSVESETLLGDEDAGQNRAVLKAKFKMYDKRAALEAMGRELGMFSQKVKVSGDPEGPPIKTESMSGLDFARLVAHSLRAAVEAKKDDG